MDTVQCRIFSSSCFLLKNVNSKGFFSCGIETKVRHMFNSHKHLKHKLKLNK